MTRGIEKWIDKRTGKTFTFDKTLKNPDALDETRGILLKYATKNNNGLNNIDTVEIVKRAWKSRVDVEGENVKRER